MSEWQPIDTVPRDEAVLATDGNERCIWIASEMDNAGMRAWLGLEIFTPTHWMPLPDPPRSEHS